MEPTVRGTVHGPGGPVRWFLSGRASPALPLVLLSGGPGLSAHYLEPIARLSDERPVLEFDPAGSGRSGRVRALPGQNITGFIREVRAVLGAGHITRAHFYGHSWGAFLALRYAQRYPAQVASLTLGSPLVSVGSWRRDTRRLIDALPPPDAEALRRGPSHARYAEAEALYHYRYFCRILPWPDPLRMSMGSMNTETYIRMWGSTEFAPTGTLRGEDATPAVRSLAIPSLWVAGSEDQTRPATVRALAALARAGHSHILSDATHNAHLEKPEEYRALIRPFLAEVESALRR